MPFKSYKEESRTNWGRTLCEKQFLSDEDLKLGALFRIADAIEIMARNHRQLIDEADKYKCWYESERKIAERLVRRTSGLRGYIKRLKKTKGK